LNIQEALIPRNKISSFSFFLDLMDNKRYTKNFFETQRGKEIKTQIKTDMSQ